MSRKRRQISHEYPYHVRARSNNREWFSLSPNICWNIFSVFLYHVAEAYSAQIHAFVLMNNHFHLVLSTPEANLPTIMNRLMTETAIAINEKSKRTNHVYGGTYRATLISYREYYANVIRYVFQNPVRAGLCQRVENYPYSTLFGQLGGSHLLIPIEERNMNGLVPSYTSDHFLNWVNTSYDKETSHEISKNLRKKVFKFSGRFLEKYDMPHTPIKDEPNATFLQKALSAF